MRLRSATPVLGLVATLLCLFSFSALAQAPDSFMFEVRSKARGAVPEEYQRTQPAWQTCAGVQWSPARKTHTYLYLGRVGQTAWQYQVKGARGNEFTLYACENWRWNPGDGVIIRGYTDSAGVFIPQGVRCYAAR